MTGSERLVFSISRWGGMNIQWRRKQTETHHEALHLRWHQTPPGALISEDSFWHAETGKGDSVQTNVQSSFVHLCLSNVNLSSTLRPSFPSACARQHSRRGCRGQSPVPQQRAQHASKDNQSVMKCSVLNVQVWCFRQALRMVQSSRLRKKQRSKKQMSMENMTTGSQLFRLPSIWKRNTEERSFKKVVCQKDDSKRCNRKLQESLCMNSMGGVGGLWTFFPCDYWSGLPGIG